MVSVIIPSYNCAVYVGEAVGSVLAQTHAQVEVIVIDDGSTDDTVAVLAAIDDSRLTVIRTPNRGMSAARNTGLDRASGEYIAFLDADDRWLPSKLERQVAMMRDRPDLAASVTNIRRFGAEGYRPGAQFDYYPLPKGDTVLAGDPFATCMRWPEMPGFVQSALVRASLCGDLRFHGAQDAGGRWAFSEDGHYLFRTFLRGRAGFIAAPLTEVRRHERNASPKAAQADYALVYARARVGMLMALQGERLTAAQRSALRDRTGRELVLVGCAYRRMGLRSLAIRSCARALAYGHRMQAVYHAVRALVV